MEILAMLDAAIRATPYIRGVMIQVSPDSGRNFYDIIDEPINRWSYWSYSWTVPLEISDGSGGMVSLASKEAMIRVHDHWDENIGDNSDNVFTIGPTLALLEPNGDTVYHTGDTISIRWEALNYSITSVVIQLSVDGGDEFPDLTPEALLRYSIDDLPRFVLFHDGHAYPQKLFRKVPFVQHGFMLQWVSKTVK